MLFDSVYRKDGNYYPKVFSEKFIHNFFGEILVFGAFKIPPKNKKSSIS